MFLDVYVILSFFPLQYINFNLTLHHVSFLGTHQIIEVTSVLSYLQTTLSFVVMSYLARVADFELARLIRIDEPISDLAGTYGYIAPG